jgi:AcrR family transcriptional regulator
MANKNELNPVLFELLDPKPRKAEEVKARIIEAAIQVIAEEGIENASLDNIGKRLKMKRSHIAYYFKSHDELIELVLVYITRMVQTLTIRLLEKAETPEEKLSSIVRAVFLWAAEHPPHIATYLLYYSMCSRLKKYQTNFQETRRLGAERLRDIVAAVNGKKGRDFNLISVAIQGIVLGNIFEAAAKGQLSDKRHMHQQEKYIVSLILQMAKDA